MAYQPVAEVVTESTTVTGTGARSACAPADLGEALCHTLIPLTGSPSVPVTRPSTTTWAGRLL
jgi:hypothetical protein